MAKRKKGYEPNNWKLIKDTPSDCFPEITYDDFYEWTVINWKINSSHECIIRATNLETRKVTEHPYKYRGAAYKFIERLIDTHEFVVVDHEAVHALTPKPKSKK
tara:strand:+ start:132 stop:443 length:312 start_codon:yes stop_codon:yes gene_type:complete